MNDSLFNALGIFLDAMRLFAIGVIQKHYPDEPWEGKFFERLRADKQEYWNRAIRRGSTPKRTRATTSATV